MSKVMAVNAGSSSLKFKLFQMPEETVLTDGVVERIGMDDAIFTIRVNGEKISHTEPIKDHQQAVNMLLDALVDYKIVNKLDEIDPDGKKCVFVVGHLSAIYYFNNGNLSETMVNGNLALFYDIFKGHQNTFYLYGHVHGESSCYTKHSSGAILHIGENNMPIGNNLNENDSMGKKYDYSFVHMGGLRPFGGQYFENDGLEGYGGENERKYFHMTATPTLAQYLVFEVYSDRVVFHVRNTGNHEMYNKKDKLQEYTVYLM